MPYKIIKLYLYSIFDLIFDLEAKRLRFNAQA